MDPTLYGTNSSNIPTRAVNDNDFENRLYFTLLNKNIKKCNTLNSTNMSNCNTFYNNATATINNRFNSEYTNASSYVYSNPVNNKFQDYPTFDDTNCKPYYGKNRKYNVSASYTFPVINVHNDYIKNGFTTDNIQSIKNLKINESISLTNIQTKESIIFTRINDTYPEQYKLNRTYNCNDNPYRTTGYINSLWTKSTGCTVPLNSNILTNLKTNYDTLQYTENETNIINIFNSYKLENITNDYNKLKQCNGDNGYVTINGSNKNQYIAGTILLPGIKFSKNATNGIIILKNGDFTLKILDTGHIYIYGLNDTILFNGLKFNNSNEISMQHDGNLIIIDINNTILWKSNTVGNYGAYLELATNGSLMIKKSNGEIIKYIFISPNQINTIWKDTTGCTKDLNDSIYTNLSTSYSALSILDSIANVATKFNPFTKNILISVPNTNNIKLCYGDNNSTGYITVDNTNKGQYIAGTILLPGLKFVAKDMYILQNTTHKLLIDANGTFYFAKITPWTQLFVPSYTAVDFSSLIMQHDGNLVVYSNATTLTALWASGTGGNAGAYLELATNGSLMIKSTAGVIIKYLYIVNDQINTIWKDATGCTQGLNDSILTNLSTSYSALSILDSIANVATKFNPFTKNTLTATPNTSKIKLCYGDNGYITVDNTNKTQYIAGTILLPGIKLDKGMKEGLVILKNGKYSFSILETGALYIYGPTTNAFYTVGNLSSLVMQHDGNLIIYSNTVPPTALWASGTGDNPGAYLELEDTGSLYIKNAKGVIIKYLWDRVGNHLTTYFWDNSPDAVFSDKKSRVFPFKWNDSAVMTNGLLDANKIPSDDCCGNYNQFRGWFRSSGDSPWNERELNLLSIYNYIQKSDGAQPVKDDNNDYNYNSSSDRVNFYNDGDSIRKPAQFTIGGIGKSNYIPGYTRISYVDGTGGSGYSYKFLIMDRGSSKYNQAFVLYKKIQDRSIFATDIKINHPDIVNGLKDFYRNN